MLTFCQFGAALGCLGSGHAQVFITIGCHICSFLARLVRMLLVAAGVASIAFFQSGHRFGGRHDRLVGMGRIGGAGMMAAAQYTSRENEEGKVCLCHNLSSFMRVWNDWIALETAQCKTRSACGRRERALSLSF